MKTTNEWDNEDDENDINDKEDERKKEENNKKRIEKIKNERIEEMKKEEKEETQFISCYLNSNIKNAEDVEKHLEKLQKEITELNHTLMDKVEKQITYKNEYENILNNIKEKMTMIKKRVNDVDKKRDENEEILKTLCSDVKKLDTGKKNVTITIIILKRIVMIITAISNLKKKALRREYKECIPLISVIKEMIVIISNLKTNEKLQILFKDVHILFNDLKNQIKEDIDLIYDNDIHIENNIIILNESNKEKIQINLYDACNCLYYLNTSFTNVIIKQFVNFSLEKYILIFENQSDSLETIDRRISWLKRCLNNYDHKYAVIFPPIFNIPFHIVKKFCLITKKQLLKFMSSSIEEINPVLLIKAVIKVIEFENFLTKNIKYVEEQETVVDENVSSVDFPFPELIMKGGGEIKEEKRKKDSEDSNVKQQSSFSSTNKNDDSTDQLRKEEKHTDKVRNETGFKGFISCIFDNYLCSWLKYEEKKILIKYEEIIKEGIEEDINNTNTNERKKTGSSESLGVENKINYLIKGKSEVNGKEIEMIPNEQYTVYKSAYKIFYLYKSYIDIILLFSKCQTLYDFFLFFKILLSKYADELNKRIVKKIKEENKTVHFKTLSILMNTSCYVEQSINEAYENMLTNIDAIYKDTISFKEEEKLFLNIKTKCIKIIIDFLERQINTILSNNSIINISDINKIKQKSVYIININQFLQYYFTLFKNIFNETYLTYLLEKITTIIIQRFYQVIFSFDFLYDATAQQLLLDCYELKHILFNVPKIWNPDFVNEEEKDIISKKKEHKRNDNGKEEINTTTDQQKLLEENLLLQADEPLIPRSYFNYIKNQMNRIEFLIKIFLSDIYDLDTFSSLLNDNNSICTIAEIEQILSLKEKKNANMQSDFRKGKNSIYDFTKKGKQATEEVKVFFNKITNM